MFVVLRLVLLRQQTLRILDPEELFNLRLVNQIARGHAIGGIEQYWYGSVVGGAGGGSLVVSWLMVPLSPVLGTGIAVLRFQAMCWALLGAVSAAFVGRSLFGRWGAAGVLLGVAVAPPFLVAGSLASHGNYAEGSSLALLMLALALHRPEGRLALARAVALGALVTFSTWFLPLYVPFYVAAFLLAFVRGLGSKAAVAALAGGLVLGAVPWVALLHVAPNVPLAEEGPEAPAPGARAEALSRLGAWKGLVIEVATSLQISPDYPEPEDGEGWPQVPLPDWAFRSLNWTGSLLLLAMGVHAARRRRPAGEAPARRRAEVFALLLLGLASVVLPVGLAAIGFGPQGIDDLGVPRVWFWDPRRMILAQWFQAIGVGGAVALLAAAGRAGRGAALVLTIVLLALPGGRTLSAALRGEPIEHPFRVERYGFCPTEEPVQWSEYCAVYTEPDQLEALNELTEHPDLRLPSDLRAALLAYQAVAGGWDEECFIEEREPIGAGATAPAIGASWRARGRAIANRECPNADRGSLCDDAPSEELRALCRDAASQLSDWQKSQPR